MLERFSGVYGNSCLLGFRADLTFLLCGGGMASGLIACCWNACQWTTATIPCSVSQRVLWSCLHVAEERFRGLAACYCIVCQRAKAVCGGRTGLGLGCLMLAHLVLRSSGRSRTLLVPLLSWACPQVATAVVEPYRTVLRVHSSLVMLDRLVLRTSGSSCLLLVPFSTWACPQVATAVVEPFCCVRALVA